MAENENVVKLPDLLERRAIRIDAAIARRAKGEQDWIEGTIELAVELAGARNDFPGNVEFGEWFDKRYRNAAITKDERPILIRWGNAPDEVRTVLTQEKSISVRMIDSHHPDLGKPPRAKATPPLPLPPKTTAVREEAKEIIRAYKAEHGGYPSVTQAGKVVGKSRIVIEPALAAVVAEDAVAPKAFTFVKAQDKEIEARIKVLSQQLEDQFEARVITETKKRIDVLFPQLDKLQEDAKLMEKYHRERLEKIAIFTDVEYRDLLLCTHEGNPSKEVRERAFIALNAKKLQLTGKK